MDKDSSYKSNLKSTAVFGGTQVIQMIITVFRAKLIAVILGSHGMGLNAIFQSTLAIIVSFSSFGIFQSAVRDFSQAYETNDKRALSKIKYVFDRMVWCSGILGMTICLVLSFWLSKFSFQNDEFTLHFILLSFGVLATALSNSQTVFLQGTRNLGFLGKASAVGAFFSLLLSIPLFIYLGIIGVVIAITLTPIVLYITQLYFTNKIEIETHLTLSLKEMFEHSKPIFKLGVVLMFGIVVLTGFTYLTNIFISRYGKIEDLGLFQGVSSITMQSIAIIIAVSASDFFPRLSAVYKNAEKVKTMVNQQLELVSIVIAPILVALISFSPIIIRLLLSKEFLPVVPMFRLFALSLICRGIWLTMSYTILAHGDKKSYFIYDSLVGNGLVFILNILSYLKWGLFGLGISSLLGSFAVTIILFLVVKKKFKFEINSDVLKVLLVLTLLALSSFFVTYLLKGIIQYFVSTLVFLFTCAFSLFILNNRTQFFKKVPSIFLKK